MAAQKRCPLSVAVVIDDLEGATFLALTVGLPAPPPPDECAPSESRFVGRLAQTQTDSRKGGYGEEGGERVGKEGAIDGFIRLRRWWYGRDHRRGYPESGAHLGMD